jgi:uroporphyrin-III C-methyltransferase/precorrin-2 dehydrogenase/sirohydrochlorin ferrochelatase
MRFFPIFLDLRAGTVVLVGSGEPALNKLRLLRAAGASVRHFVAAHRAIDGDAADPMVAVLRDGEVPELSGAIAVVSAAGDPVDTLVAARAKALRIPVNVVDRPELSTFVVPAIVDRGDVVVAIGTGGAAPVLARRLRERIEALLPTRIGELSALMGRHRERLAAVLSHGFARRRFWEQVVDGPIATAVLSGRRSDAEISLAIAIDTAGPAAGRQSGTVFLVGAGSGDPDLLTLRALHVLQGADVVLYDELVPAPVLDRARRDAARILVGKPRGAPGVGQDEINREINRRSVEAAGAGHQVVWLKGGDPFVLGRDGEEIAALREAGVPVVVVPGITSALWNQPASAGAEEAA